MCSSLGDMWSVDTIVALNHAERLNRNFFSEFLIIRENQKSKWYGGKTIFKFLLCVMVYLVLNTILEYRYHDKFELIKPKKFKIKCCSKLFPFRTSAAITNFSVSSACIFTYLNCFNISIRYFEICTYLESVSINNYIKI